MSRLTDELVSDGPVALDCVQQLTPYQPGKPIDELEREFGISNVVKLASNENPLGMSPLAREAIDSELDNLALYPDGSGHYLKAKLAKKLSLSVDQITLGNGSNDVLEIIARCYADSKSEIIYSQYGFAIYPIVTQAVGASHVCVNANNYGHDLHLMLAAVTDKTAIIYIANPNNPTGTFLSSEELKTFVRSVPKNVVVVIDEAYHEYISENPYESAVLWVSQFPNLIVSRTFSKAYGLAGLRIGYCVSDKSVGNILNRVRQPFNTNTLALVAANAALDDDLFLKNVVNLNNSGLQQLQFAFDKMGLYFIPSKGNFVAVDVACDGEKAYEALLRVGVIVRPIGAYGLPTFIRVTVGTEEQNDRFLQSLSNVLAEMKD